MSTVSTGQVSFSHMRDVFLRGGGEIKFSTLATVDARATSGTPTSNSNISVSAFRGKSRPFLPGWLCRIITGMYFADNVDNIDYRHETYAPFRVTDMSSIYTATGGTIPVDGWDTYSVEWTGYFYAPSEGWYSFWTHSDDASYMWLQSPHIYNIGSAYEGTMSNPFISNGGIHSMQKIGASTYMYPGYWPIKVVFGENGGGDNCIISFAGPGIAETTNWNGYIFSSLGTHLSYPALSARLVKRLVATAGYNWNDDRVLYISTSGASTPIYCLMDDGWNGGGWMMLMKSTRGETFQFYSGYWTDGSTTLNTGETNRNDGDAKFNTFNRLRVKDVMATWPDVGYTGGSISGMGVWTWLVNNWYSGHRVTALDGFAEGNTRNVVSSGIVDYSDPWSFPGFSSTIWSYQGGSRAFVFGGGGHHTNTTRVRWGFLWNNEWDFGSNDVTGGIAYRMWWNGGMQSGSGGDMYHCCGAPGLNRTMRYELYGR